MIPTIARIMTNFFFINVWRNIRLELKVWNRYLVLNQTICPIYNNREIGLIFNCRIWLGMRDSNPRSWDQNPVPYRLANPQLLWFLWKAVRCALASSACPQNVHTVNKFTIWTVLLQPATSGFHTWPIPIDKKYYNPLVGFRIIKNEI